MILLHALLQCSYTAATVHTVSDRPDRDVAMRSCMSFSYVLPEQPYNQEVYNSTTRHHNNNNYITTFYQR